MKKFPIELHKGTIIGENEFRREVKLFTSPKSLIETPDFALGMTVIEPGQKHESHAHDANQEVMIIYEGSGIAIIDNVETKVCKGDVISVAKNESHGFVNTGEENLEIIWIYYPPGVADKKFLRKD